MVLKASKGVFLCTAVIALPQEGDAPKEVCLRIEGAQANGGGGFPNHAVPLALVRRCQRPGVVPVEGDGAGLQPETEHEDGDAPDLDTFPNPVDG